MVNVSTSVPHTIMFNPNYVYIFGWWRNVLRNVFLVNIEISCMNIINQESRCNQVQWNWVWRIVVNFIFYLILISSKCFSFLKYVIIWYCMRIFLKLILNILQSFINLLGYFLYLYHHRCMYPSSLCSAVDSASDF